jgi:hypothetical protein
MKDFSCLIEGYILNCKVPKNISCELSENPIDSHGKLLFPNTLIPCEARALAYAYEYFTNIPKLVARIKSAPNGANQGAADPVGVAANNNALHADIPRGEIIESNVVCNYCANKNAVKCDEVHTPVCFQGIAARKAEQGGSVCG